MRNLIIVIISLISTIGFSQVDSIQKSIHSFTLGVDVANTVKGGSVNGRATNFHLKYLLESPREGVEVGFLYERFPKLNFEFFGMPINKKFKVGKNISLVAGLEHGVIHRWKGLLFPLEDSHTYTYSYGVNAEVRYQLNDRWVFGIQHNNRRRLDIGTKWVGSNFFNIQYLIQRKNK